MRRDELRQPLKRRGIFERAWAKRPSALACVAGLSGGLILAAGVWLVRTPMPFAGEPVLVFAIPQAEAMTTASVSKAPDGEPAETPPEEEEIADTGAEPPLPDEPVIIRPSQREANGGANIITSSRRNLAAAPIAAVAEEGPYGQLPRIGRGNKRPSEVYARSTPRGIIASDTPKIAIVLGGMGLNADLTAQAVKRLPGEVTFAFAPYGDNLQPQVNRARAGGHEILLQVPMEPFGYPATNPGPKTLLSSNDANTNLDAMMWHMGRFSGYTGVMNYMGGRFLTEPAAMKPVFVEARRRGLLFLSDGTVNRSLAAELGGSTGLPVAEAALVIDASATPEGIGAKLLELERIAARDGVAVGTGAGLAMTIDAVEEWSKSLASRGIVLVPASAAFKKRGG